MKLILVPIATSIIVAVGCSGSVVIVRNDPIVSDGGTDSGSSDAGIVDAAKDAATDAPKGLPGGAPCESDDDCAYATCLPSNGVRIIVSYCFDREQFGCMVVTEPSPIASLCNAPAKVFVCGDSWDISTLGACADVAVGMLGEVYHCCKQ